MTLKLKANDEEDLTIISAYLQDAVAVVGDMVYQAKSRRFVIMLNRYVWENTCPDTGEPIPGESMSCSRIRSGLHFESILKVSSQRLPRNLKTHVMELLAIETFETVDGNVIIDLIFAGDELIRLEAEILDGAMQDIGEPWPAQCHPKHKILEALR